MTTAPPIVCSSCGGPVGLTWIMGADQKPYCLYCWTRIENEMARAEEELAARVAETEAELAQRAVAEEGERC